MAKSRRGILREELSSRFIPYLQSIGFESTDDSLRRDSRRIFPFGTLVRRHGTTADVIKIQFDKYSRPRFIVNFRREPTEIVHVRHIKSREVASSESFRLHPKPNSAGWFTMRTFLGLHTVEACAERVVDQLMSLVPEIERWFNEETVGKHMRHLSRRYSVE